MDPIVAIAAALGRYALGFAVGLLAADWLRSKSRESAREVYMAEIRRLHEVIRTHRCATAARQGWSLADEMAAVEPKVLH